MCSGSEEGSSLRLIEFLYHSTLGLQNDKEEEEYPQAIATIWVETQTHSMHLKHVQ